MEVIRSNTWTYVKEIENEELKLLQKSLTFFDSKAKYSWKFRAKKWNGKYCLYHKRDKTFPSGLFEYIRHVFLKKKFNLSFTDARKCNHFPDDSYDISWLRDYQRDAYDALTEHGAGILQGSTGSGKTNIAVSLMYSIRCPWIFLAHKKDLIHQARKRYMDLIDEKCGIIGDGKWEDDYRIIFATFQTLNSAIKNDDPRIINILKKTEGIIIDEAHCVSASTFWDMAMMFENAYYRFGLSATPLAKDDKNNMLVMSSTGPVRYKITSRELINKGWLAEPIIEMHEVSQEFDDIKNIKKHKWHDVNQKYITESDKRNDKIVELVKIATKPSLLFINLEEHGKYLEERLANEGLNTKFVWGKKNTKFRRDAIDELVDGDIDIIIASVVFNEGIDIPELKSVIIGSAGKSIISTLQKIGRGMRRVDGKSIFEVYDIFDTSVGHPWLFHQSKKRLKTYEDETFKVKVVPKKNETNQNTKK